MKKLNIVLILLFSFILISCKSTPQSKSSPTAPHKLEKAGISGFLDLNWGDEENVFSREECTFNARKMLDWAVFGMSTYTCILDEETFGIVGSKHALTYYNSKYFMGTVFFDGEKNYQIALNNIYDTYGKPSEVFDKKDAWAQTMEYKYHWRLNLVLIQLKYDPQEDNGTISILYTPVSNRIDGILIDKKRVDTWNDQIKIEDLY